MPLFGKEMNGKDGKVCSVGVAVLVGGVDLRLDLGNHAGPTSTLRKEKEGLARKGQSWQGK
jgi:hypothetical protein